MPAADAPGPLFVPVQLGQLARELPHLRMTDRDGEGVRAVGRPIEGAAEEG